MRIACSMSRPGHGLSRLCHGSKPRFQPMFAIVVTTSRLQDPMRHPPPPFPDQGADHWLVLKCRMTVGTSALGNRTNLQRLTIIRTYPNLSEPNRTKNTPEKLNGRTTNGTNEHEYTNWEMEDGRRGKVEIWKAESSNRPNRPQTDPR